MSIRSYDPVNDFIHSTLTQITGAPSRASIKTLIKENKDNARNIHSARGAGDEGHLRLCYQLVDYNARAHLAGNPWIDPAHPGARPNIPPGATAAQIQNEVANHQYDLQEFQVFQSTEKALLKLAMQATEEVYYKALEDPEEGYSHVRYIDFVEHLQETYGQLTNDDLDKNIERMNTKWSPNDPIEQLFNQINDAQAFARGHDEITDRSALRAGLKNLENSGVFPLALKDWRAKPTPQQTWANFQTHFKEANNERIRTVTTKQAGYHDQHQANAANTDNPYIVTLNGESMSYCFSHGLQWDLTHNSKTCRNRHAEHNQKATLMNMCGGRCQIKRKPGESPIVKFVPNNRNTRTPNNGNANHSARSDSTDRTTTTTESDVSSLSTGRTPDN
ncbi:hypothetical protein SEMRO_610_G175150.1 [Seminavis robusta]|uniref:Uncharacterized protein n=1 Tax=Seminavis robusta TaxID=568900 RepID=A0A9N8E6Z4_9STRA|nr:hypothetical protein SEMRO_610_G175150.1 [Seminavis robusta]|eukprot:Sro610_g175150.1 n/a (390) ;mRNA; f:29704-30873